MPKRRGQENQNQGDGGEFAGKRSRPVRRRRKHLYLVLDDWNKGFSVHKIDPDTFDSDSDDDDDDQDHRAAVAGHLPEPPALRLESPGPRVGMSYAALGSKIFAVTDAGFGQTPALIYDTETAGLAFGPAVPAHLQCGVRVVVPAGETLYAFSPPAWNKRHTFEAMSWTPAVSRVSRDARYPSEEGLSWRSLPPPPPPPFDVDEIITSHALHPDGRTVFMTTSYRNRPNLHKSTRSFNTKYCVWRWHDWVLPFRYEGYFDGELDAWVGLHRDGYVCCCQVPSDIGSETPVELGAAQLDCQMVEDGLFHKENERYLNASLAYMGRSRFCLVESVIRKGAKEEYHLGDDDGCVLHMTMFGLKYTHKGELRVTNHRSKRSYRVSRHRDYFFPQAFWV